MLFSIKNRHELENLKELITLQSRVKTLGLHDMFNKQNCHEDLRKLFETFTNTNEDTSRYITKTMMETCIENNKELKNLIDKLLEIMNHRGMLASYLLSPLSKITNLEHTSQYKLVKDPSSSRVNNLLINRTIAVTLYNKLLAFRDTNRNFKLRVGILKMITNKNYNIDLAKVSDKKLLYDFSKEVNFDEKAVDNKSTRD